MVSERVPNYMTVEEYVAYELEMGIKHEYINGEIYAMVGGTDPHNTIALNCIGELRDHLRKKPCRAFSSETKIKISDLKYIYPDFAATCGEPQFADEKHTMLINPTFVGEVMSPSSRNYDKGDKADYYFSLPSVQAYLLLDQEKPHAQLFTRNEIGWQLQEFEGIEAVVPLVVIGCELKLSEAYLDVFN